MGQSDSNEEDATIYGGQEVADSSEISDADRTIFATDVAAPTDPDAAKDEATVFGEPTATPAADRSDPTFEAMDRTRHAMAAVQLGTLFRHRFASARFGLSPRYEVRLNAPDGPSTAGGALARQSIVLFKEGRPGERGLVVGWVDAASSQAVLRSHELFGRHFELRFKRRSDLLESEYERLLDELRRFTDSQSLNVKMIEQESLPQPRRARASDASLGRQFGLREIIGVIAAVLAVGMVLGYLLAS